MLTSGAHQSLSIYEATTVFPQQSKATVIISVVQGNVCCSYSGNGGVLQEISSIRDFQGAIVALYASQTHYLAIQDYPTVYGVKDIDYRRLIDCHYDRYGSIQSILRVFDRLFGIDYKWAIILSLSS